MSEMAPESFDAIVQDLHESEAENEQIQARLERAEEILRKAQAPRRPDGTYNYSREAFEQMANDYFGGMAES